MKPISIGIVGLGFMAATHLKAYRQVPGARIAALCNPSGRHLDGDFSNVAGNIGDNQPLRIDMSGVKAYRDYAAMLADPEIDAIDICAPTGTHEELAVAALRAGKHVLCEKPLARNSAQARRIVEAARVAKGFFMPAMCIRFAPEWAFLKQAIHDGRFGKVLAATFRRVAEPPGWGQHNFLNGERSGGALLDLHIHDADFVQYCFGVPRSVLATGYTHLSGAIDHVITNYEVASGAMVYAEGTWAMTPGFGFNMSYTANFERATLDYDMSRGKDALKLAEKGQPARVIAGTGTDCYIEELRYFVDAIANQRPPSVVNADDGLKAVELCEAEEKSIQTGERVTLD